MGPKFSHYESKLKSQPGALELRFIFHVHLSLFPSKPFSAMPRNISLVLTKQTKKKIIVILLNVSGFINSFSLRSKVHNMTFCLNPWGTKGEIHRIYAKEWCGFKS